MATKALAEATLRIFGHVKVDGVRSGRKLLKNKLVGPTLMEWYMPTLKELKLPHIESAMEERRKLKLEKLRRKGKGPPKKGQGQRSKKK